MGGGKIEDKEKKFSILQKEGEKMKRPLTLTGGILGIVAQSLIMIFSLINVILVVPAFGHGADSVIAVAVLLAVVALAVGIIGLIFNIKAVVCWNKPAGDYKKGSVIVALVFNFLGAAAGFLVMNLVIAVLVMLVLIAAAVLQIVDVAREGKRAVQA